METSPVLDFQQKNVGELERTASTMLGGGLAIYGLGLKSWSGVGLALLGGMIAARGLSGHCPLYSAVGVDTCGCDSQSVLDATYAVKVEKSIVVNAPIEKAWSLWRDFTSFPRFMEHVALVEEIDALRSHWVIKAPFNRTVEWDAEIINEIPNELIAWRSMPDSMLAHAGSVRFRELPFDRGTEVKVKLEYQAPAGVVGNTLAKLLGQPGVQVHEDLRHFKQIIETGEVATTCGQPVGVAM